MAKERSAAIAMLLVLAAIAWGVVWTSKSAPQGSPTPAAGVDRTDSTKSPDIVEDDLQTPSPSIQLASRSVEIEPFPTLHDQQRAGLALASKKPAAMSGAASRPATLTAPHDAQPLAPPAGENEALRTIIKGILPGADAAAVRIWEKELRGFSLSDARNILQMRTQMPLHDHAGPMMPMFSKPDVGPNCPLGSEPFPQVVVRPAQRSFPPVVTSSLQAIERARGVILHNIANARTPSFKRSTVLFGEVAGRTAAAGGVEVVAIRRDWSTGSLLKTNRPTDVAVEGKGFFALKCGKTVCYTRVGNFQLDKANRITRVADGKCYLVEVECSRVTVGEAVTGIALSSAVMKAHNSNCPVERFKGITLVRFVHPDGLKPLGGGLYAETPESGPPTKGKPGERGFGSLRPRFLEQSNVDVEREMQTLQQLARQRTALIAAAEFWEAPLNVTPIPLPTVNEPMPKPAAMVRPKRRVEVRLDFNLKDLLPKLRFSASKAPSNR